MVIDHLCIAVKSIKDGIIQWTAVYGYSQKTKTIINTLQKVEVVFLHKDDSLDIKLIGPIDESSPIYHFTRRGGGLHHICFKCDNIDEEVDRLKNNGLRLLAGPQSGEAFENEKIAFLLDKLGVNLELIDTDKKAGLI